MQKLILITLFIAVASAQLYLPSHLRRHIKNDPNPLTLFLKGFNNALHIADPSDLDKCVSVPLIHDINKTLCDLNISHPNITELAKDFKALTADFILLRKTCPEVARVYEAYFHKFVKAATLHPEITFARVIYNVGAHYKNFSSHVDAAQTDFHKEDYFAAGKDVGGATAIALHGYIVV